MKNILLVLLSLVLVLGIAVTGCAKPAAVPPGATTLTPTPTGTATPTAAVKPIELRWASENAPTNNTQQRVINPWINEVEKRSNGRVKITMYYSEALGKAATYLDLLLSGVCDICDTSLAYYPGLSYLMDALTLPWLVPPNNDPKRMAVEEKIWWEYIIPLELDKTVKVPWTKSAGGTVLHMVNTPVRTMEDLKGKLIGIAGGKSNESILKSLGASPEVVRVPDHYTALERKLIDGLLFPFSSQRMARLYEVTKYVTMVESGGGPRVYFISLKTWKSLPPDIQKIIDDLRPWVTKLNHEVSIEEDQNTMKEVLAHGLEIIYLSPEEKARWVKATEHIEKQFMADMDARGLPGTKLVTEVRQLIAAK